MRRDWSIDKVGVLTFSAPWFQRRDRWLAALERLYADRFEVIERKYSDRGRPTDPALQRHLEREIDWYELKIYEPSHAWHQWRIRKVDRLVRRVNRFLITVDEANRRLGLAPNQNP